jgi:hypothetical protein
MPKKKRYEYRERNQEDDFGFRREKKKSNKMKPNDRWRKTDFTAINYTGDEYDEQEEWEERE